MRPLLRGGPWEKRGLTLAAHTLGDGPSFEERVSAAAAAGFGGIGLRAENYRAARGQGLADQDLLNLLGRHEIAVTEVEFLGSWANDRAPALRADEDTIVHMAHLFGVGHVNAGLPEPAPEGADLPRRLAELVDRVDGLSVALEFLPYGAIPTLRDAIGLLEVSSKVDLLLDVWHLTRADTGPADLEATPMDRVRTLQLCDTAAKPFSDPRYEALHHRLPPGKGTAPIADILNTLNRGGAQPEVISIEIASDELSSRGQQQAAHTAWITSSDVLENHDVNKPAPKPASFLDRQSPHR